MEETFYIINEAEQELLILGRADVINIINDYRMNFETDNLEEGETVESILITEQEGKELSYNDLNSYLNDTYYTNHIFMVTINNKIVYRNIKEFSTQLQEV